MAVIDRSYAPVLISINIIHFVQFSLTGRNHDNIFILLNCRGTSVLIDYALLLLVLLNYITPQGCHLSIQINVKDWTLSAHIQRAKWRHLLGSTEPPPKRGGCHQSSLAKFKGWVGWDIRLCCLRWPHSFKPWSNQSNDFRIDTCRPLAWRLALLG